jgi:hypothetical protein
MPFEKAAEYQFKNSPKIINLIKSKSTTTRIVNGYAGNRHFFVCHIVRTMIISSVHILFCFFIESQTKKSRHFDIHPGCYHIILEMIRPEIII